MLKTILSASGISIALLSGAASAATVSVDVYAAENSTTGGTGGAVSLFLYAGQTFTVTADPDDLWILGGPPGREGNADGLPLYPGYSQGGLTDNFGTLVGRIGEVGDFFEIGTNYSGMASTTGQLYLFNFDSNSFDNEGFITAVASVPLPAGGLLLLGALGGIAALRRRKAV